ncbi:hypothetical protein JCM10212_000817 [Sporobolomyces blumeae]
MSSKPGYLTPPYTPTLDSSSVARPSAEPTSRDPVDPADFDPLAGYPDRPPSPPASSEDNQATDPRPTARRARTSSSKKMDAASGAPPRATSASAARGAVGDMDTATGTPHEGSGTGVRSRKRKAEPPKHPEVSATHEDWQAQQDVEQSDMSQHFPLVLVALPTFLSIIHGRAENWSDAIILLLTGFYLYNLVKVPWEIYNASYSRRVLPPSMTGDSISNEDDPPIVRQQRQASAAALRRNEFFALLATVLVPAIGAYALLYVRGILSDPDRYINETMINLFSIATAIKPLRHVVKLLKNNSLYHQEVVHYPSTEVHRLRQKVDKLEADLVQLSRAFATKQDVRALRDGVDVPLTALSKAVRRFNRKEEYLRLTSEERFTLLSQRLDESIEVSQAQQRALEELERERERERERIERYQKVEFANLLGRLLGHVFAGPSYTVPPQPSITASSTSTYKKGRLPASSSKDKLGWYEQGINWYLFWPVNLPKKAVGWATDKAGQTVKGIEQGLVEEKELEKEFRNSSARGAAGDRKSVRRKTNALRATSQAGTSRSSRAHVAEGPTPRERDPTRHQPSAAGNSKEDDVPQGGLTTESGDPTRPVTPSIAVPTPAQATRESPNLEAKGEERDEEGRDVDYGSPESLARALAGVSVRPGGNGDTVITAQDPESTISSTDRSRRGDSASVPHTPDDTKKTSTTSPRSATPTTAAGVAGAPPAQDEPEEEWMLKSIAWPPLPPRPAASAQHGFETSELRVKIIQQNRNGPCSLIALCNVLILRNDLHIASGRDRVTYSYLSALLADYFLRVTSMPSAPATSNEDRPPQSQSQMSLEAALSTLPQTRYGLNLNPQFSRIDGFTSSTESGQGELALFSLARIPLLHGWIADPEDRETAEVLDEAADYDRAVEMMVAGSEVAGRLGLSGQGAVDLEEEELVKEAERRSGWSKEEEDKVRKAHLIEKFLNSTSTQLTYPGLFALSSTPSILPPSGLAALFRNSHLSVLYRRPRTPLQDTSHGADLSAAGPELFTLVTDSAFSNEHEVVWESLEDTDGSASDFFTAGLGPSRTRGGDWAGVRRAEDVPREARSTFRDEEADLALARQLQAEEEDRAAYEFERQERQRHDEERAGRSERDRSSRQDDVSGRDSRAEMQGVEPGRGLPSRSRQEASTSRADRGKSKAEKDKCVVM